MYGLNLVVSSNKIKKTFYLSHVIGIDQLN